MAQSIYVASMEGHTGKSTVALGLVNVLLGNVQKVGVFRPVVRAGAERDRVLELLLSFLPNLRYEDCVGVTYDDVHANPEDALARIIDRYRALAHDLDIVVVVGSDYTDIAGPAELEYNSRIAANLGASVLLVVRALERSPVEVLQATLLAVEEIKSNHAHVSAVVVNRITEDETRPYHDALEGLGLPVWTLPEIRLLSTATVGELMRELGGQLAFGDASLLSREAEHLLVAGMNVEHVLDRLKEGQVVITPSDRNEVLIALIAAHAAEGFPSLSAIILNGGFPVPPTVARLVRGFGQRLPIVETTYDSYRTAQVCSVTRGSLTPRTQRKIDLALSTFEEHISAQSVLTKLDFRRSDVVTPLMFEAELLDRARADRRHIVLPEGDDDRILRAASTLLARQVARLTILGNEAAIRARAKELGLDLSAADILSPDDPTLIEKFATEYARLRSHKGMTVDRAREIVRDVSYFGTMMVHLGLADGMVSGAVHTTAHTIKPSFEIIKTKPGVSIVSSVFLMLMEDRVLVYGDCAVNPDPTAEQLADIAISSAETAKQFGVEPRVAMLSYSTGESGSGADVDKVRQATQLVRARAPHLSVEGPIQYDAAIEPSVAKTKLPKSEVAGRATVFIFPDLNTGNNTYKAVQRSAGAVAVGPVLQGLNKPVNDLSRGALVKDIVNTVAITAVQAQGVTDASQS
ncbi:MAG: phosphate acetyltransferase [Actinomycetales bacterium]|nr:phosphate acetyltransferase [Actinomycetales bacterium]